jgi:hypothetical protein
MAEQATTTRPTRSRSTRTAATPAAGKAAPAASKAKAAPKAEAPTEAVEVTRFTVELEHVGTTKSFEKFAFPDNYKGVVVGNVYAPIGTEQVKVLVIGANDAGDTE